jgi:hypothetical protein
MSGEYRPIKAQRKVSYLGEPTRAGKNRAKKKKHREDHPPIAH